MPIPTENLCGESVVAVRVPVILSYIADVMFSVGTFKSRTKVSSLDGDDAVIIPVYFKGPTLSATKA